MFVTETIFGQNGQPLGKLREDIFNAVVTFIPADGSKRLAGRKWKSVNACQKAVTKYYTNESPPN